MKLIPKEIEDYFQKWILKIWHIIPDKLKLPTIIFFLLGTFYLSYSYLFNINLGDSSDTEVFQDQEGPSEFEIVYIPSDANGIVYGDSISKVVTNFEDWINIEKFDSHVENINVLYPTYSAYFPEGRTMYYPEMLGGKFTAKIRFKPLSINRENIVFEFKNFFQCIIGNGNYIHVDCRVPPYGVDYLEEVNQSQKNAWINRPYGIKPQTTQTLTVEAMPVINSEVVRVFISIDYIPSNTNDGIYKTDKFEYNIYTGKPSESIEGQVGIGLIDPEKYRPYQPDKVGIEIIDFEIL